MVLILFLSFATSIIVSRILGPEKRGILALVILLPNMLVLFLNGGFNISNTYFAGSGRYDVERLLGTSITVFLFSSVIGIFIVTILFSTGLVNIILPSVPRWAILTALIIFPFGLLSTFFGGLLQGLERIVELNRIQSIQAGIAFFLTLLFVIIFRLDLIGAIAAAVLASVSGLVGFTIILKMRWNHFLPRWHPEVIKPFLSFGLRGYVANILQFFNYRLDVFIVNFFLGPAAVGIYAVSYGIAELIWNFPNAINFVLFPRIASEKGQNKNSLTVQILILSVILTSIGALILALIGQFLISFLYGNAFQEAYYPLLALLPGVILLGAAKVLTAEILGRGYPQYNSLISGLGLAVTIVGDLIMIPRFGVMGAAVSSSLSYTVILIMSVGFYFKVKPRNLATQEKNI